MKITKKIVALLLAVLMIAGTGMVSVTAASEDDDGEIVARMYLGHKERYNNMSGHTWIYIENLTDHSLTVGAYTLKKNKGVSIGTYGYLINDGRGLYYNVECYRYRGSDLSSYISLSKDLTREQLNKVSNKILNSGAWSYLLNCAYFAINTWNVVPGDRLVYMMFPTLTQLQILMNPDHAEGFKMTKPKMSEIYKQIGTGSNATLVNADPEVPE